MDDIEFTDYNEHGIAAGTAGLAKHRQPLPSEVARGRGHGRTAELNALRGVEPKSVPVAYMPPKYGPPPGYPAEKWRSLSRSARRAILRNAARQINGMVR